MRLTKIINQRRLIQENHKKNPKERQWIKKTLNSLFSVLLKTKEITHKGKILQKTKKILFRQVIKKLINK